MSADLEVAKETAIATQEVAKTTTKALEVSEKFGGFIARRIGGSLDQAIGIFEDKLKFLRWERQIRLIERVNEISANFRPIIAIKPIPLKLAIPLFEAASLEDDDYLQDLWAKLIINASDEQSNINLQRSHINILEQLTSLEARILETIYRNDFNETEHLDILTAELPEVAILMDDFDGLSAINSGGKKLIEPNNEIKLALANLARLRLLALPTTFNGKEIYNRINPTLLGQRFVKACTLCV